MRRRAEKYKIYRQNAQTLAEILLFSIQPAYV
jgi:hypothetical protein